MLDWAWQWPVLDSEQILLHTQTDRHRHTHRGNMLHTRQDNTQNLLNTNNKESAFKATAKQRRGL